MTIKKGQFTDEKTGDVLYPQTSSDMIEGLENNYLSKTGDSVNGNIIFNNNYTGVQGIDADGKAYDMLMSYYGQPEVGSINKILTLNSSVRPKWKNNSIAIQEDLSGDLTPKSVVTEKCGLINIKTNSPVFRVDNITIGEGMALENYNLDLPKGKYQLYFKNSNKINTLDNMYFRVSIGDKTYSIRTDYEYTVLIDIDVTTEYLTIHKQNISSGSGTVDSNGVLNIGVFEIRNIGTGTNKVFYAGDNFEVFDDGKVGLTGIVSEVIPTWQSDYSSEIQSLALKKDVPEATVLEIKWSEATEYIDADFPEGYNHNNCYVKGGIYQYSRDYCYSQLFNGEFTIGFRFYDYSKIRITRVAGPMPQNYGCSFKIVLEKFPE